MHRSPALRSFASAFLMTVLLAAPARLVSQGAPPAAGGAVGGGAGGGRGGGGGGIAGLDDLRQTEITRIDLALEQEVRGRATARARLVALSLTVPRDDAALRAAADALAEAELKVARGQADGFAQLQGSPLRLTPPQTQALIQYSARSGAATTAGAGAGGAGGAVLAELNRGDNTIVTESYIVRDITLLDNFRLELLYVTPASQGSWVPATFDNRGRLIVASYTTDEIYRLTLPALGSREPVRVEALGLNIGSADGLLHAFDRLYVMVNQGSTRVHGLYQLRDTNGDDRYDEIKVLRNLPGSGDHGVHAIEPSPDGKSIYVLNGNATAPTVFQSMLAPGIWGEDTLVKRAAAAADTAYGPQAWTARMDPDGKNWELFTMGSRNPVDFKFNKDGELFTFDSDMEWDKGDPWYRPTNVQHLTSGADFGFHEGARKQPQYYIDVMPPVVNIGSGSPTGVTFGTGAKFPARYQDAFFINDWSYGNIYAVHLTPKGSTYTGEAELFASGRPFSVADTVVNPRDGTMYVVVGGNAQSALYRVTYTGNEPTTPTRPDTTMAAQRELRRSLEKYHGRRDPSAVAAAWPHLGSRDPALRFAARTALEWQDPALWREKALTEKDPRQATSAIVALARVSGKDEVYRTATDPAPDQALQRRMLEALDGIGWNSLETPERLDVLRAYALTFSRLGAPDAETRRRLIAKFDPLVPAPYRELNYDLSALLVYLEAPSAPTKLMGLLRTAPSSPFYPIPSQYLNPLMLTRGTPGGAKFGNENVALARQQDEIQYAQLLRNLKVGWTPELREEYFNWYLRANAEYSGGNTFKSTLGSSRQDAINTLTDAEKTALEPVLSKAFIVPAGRGGGGGGARGGQ